MNKRHLGRQIIGNLYKLTKKSFFAGWCSIKNIVPFVVTRVRMSSILSYIATIKILIVVIFAITIVAIGLLLNYSSEKSFPAFVFYQGVLLSSLALSYLSIRRNLKVIKLTNMLMSSDIVLINCREVYKAKRESNSNYIIPIILSTSIVWMISHILILEVGVVFRIYCYAALWCIVFICSLGYIQYIRFISFVASLSNHTEAINRYNHTIPSETDWLNNLSNIASTYSVLFFIVGGLFICLFYDFTFSERFIILFKQEYLKIAFAVFWGLLVIGIVIAFPCFAILTSVYIRRIAKKLKRQRTTELFKLKSFTKEIIERNSYDSLVILIDRTPNYPENYWFRYCISSLVGLLNVWGSIVGTLQFLSLLAL